MYLRSFSLCLVALLPDSSVVRAENHWLEIQSPHLRGIKTALRATTGRELANEFDHFTRCHYLGSFAAMVFSTLGAADILELLEVEVQNDTPQTAKIVSLPTASMSNSD